MVDTAEQARMRQHLAEMSHAARGLGHDVEVNIKNADQKIAALSRYTGKELKYAMLDIQDDFARLGRTIDTELARLPQNMKEKAIAAGSAIEAGAREVGGATRDAFESAGARAREGTKNAGAWVAGVNRKPMKEWHTPPTSDAAPDDS
jgi:hypothetical protein